MEFILASTYMNNIIEKNRLVSYQTILNLPVILMGVFNANNHIFFIMPKVWSLKTLSSLDYPFLNDESNMYLHLGHGSYPAFYIPIRSVSCRLFIACAWWSMWKWTLSNYTWISFNFWSTESSKLENGQGGLVIVRESLLSGTSVKEMLDYTRSNFNFNYSLNVNYWQNKS